MKKMSVKKEMLIIMMIVLSFVVISSKVLATGTSDNPIQIPTINTTTEPTTQNDTTNITTNITTNETTNEVTPTVNQTGSTYQNTTALPQTGDASDYAIFMLIVVALVVAVYAYKKIREYNI